MTLDLGLLWHCVYINLIEIGSLGLKLVGTHRLQISSFHASSILKWPLLLGDDTIQMLATEPEAGDTVGLL
jgi:hypothetical protein